MWPKQNWLIDFWGFTSQNHDLIIRGALEEGSGNSDNPGLLTCTDVAQYTGLSIQMQQPQSGFYAAMFGSAAECHNQ